MYKSKLPSFFGNKTLYFYQFGLRNKAEISVSNGTGQCNFSGQRDRSSFIVPGQRDNGTSSKSCHGAGRDGIFYWLSCPVPGHNHFQFFPMISCFRTSFSCFRTSFSCFRPSFFLFFVFLRKVNLLLPLSRDKGTPGQENFFVPGQRDNGTSRPVETLAEIS